MGFFSDDPADHPEALDVELAGESFGWLLNKRAFTVAEEEGIDFENLDDSLDESKVADNLEALSVLLYIGTIPFREFGHETPELEEIRSVLTPRGAAQVGPPIMAQFEGIADEELQTEGK